MLSFSLFFYLYFSLSKHEADFHEIEEKHRKVSKEIYIGIKAPSFSFFLPLWLFFCLSLSFPKHDADFHEIKGKHKKVTKEICIDINSVFLSLDVFISLFNKHRAELCEIQDNYNDKTELICIGSILYLSLFLNNCKLNQFGFYRKMQKEA